MIRFISFPIIIIGATLIAVAAILSETAISILAIPYAVSEALKETYNVQMDNSKTSK